VTSVPPLAHSVRDRLLKLANARGEQFNFVLVRYALERLLYRLSMSAHGGEFILKGAMLFTIWSKLPHRATKDLDLLGSGTPDLGRLAQVFREICSTPVEDDGVVFAPRSVEARRIKEDAAYEGVRITLQGKLGSARLAVQVDVGFGDSVVPVQRRSNSRRCSRFLAPSSEPMPRKPWSPKSCTPWWTSGWRTQG
jgi:hypothetical protein